MLEASVVDPMVLNHGNFCAKMIVDDDARSNKLGAFFLRRQRCQGGVSLGIDDAVLMKAWYLVVPVRLLQSTLFVFAVAEQRLHHVGLRPEASGLFEHHVQKLC